jgi:hypothetical protein
MAGGGTGGTVRRGPSLVSFIATDGFVFGLPQLQNRVVTEPSVRCFAPHAGHSQMRRRSYFRRSKGPFIDDWGLAVG